MFSLVSMTLFSHMTSFLVGIVWFVVDMLTQSRLIGEEEIHFHHEIDTNKTKELLKETTKSLN
jgi:hypothetical protein